MVSPGTVHCCVHGVLQSIPGHRVRVGCVLPHLRSTRTSPETGFRCAHSSSPSGEKKRPTAGPGFPGNMRRLVPRRLSVFFTYALSVCATAWRSMDKVTVSMGRWQVQMPRMYSPGPMSVLGYLVLATCVVTVLFFLMDQARALTNACIRWQLAR